mmetsp:Transcript_32524/g.103714  ORF Transcript_32524/g.103714 Transcript_32524/m.103714 type:complete len:212 (+) Transcript_32524:427-1062(+)
MASVLLLSSSKVVSELFWIWNWNRNTQETLWCRTPRGGALHGGEVGGDLVVVLEARTFFEARRRVEAEDPRILVLVLVQEKNGLRGVVDRGGVDATGDQDLAEVIRRSQEGPVEALAGAAAGGVDEDGVAVVADDWSAECVVDGVDDAEVGSDFRRQGVVLVAVELDEVDARLVDDFTDVLQGLVLDDGHRQRPAPGGGAPEVRVFLGESH